MIEKKEFLSIPEAAVLLGISRIAVFKKVKKAQLPAIRIGRNWAIPAGAVSDQGFFTSPQPAFARHTPFKPKSASPTRPIPAQITPKDDSMDEMGWD